MIPRDIMNIQSAILQSTCSTNRQCALESNIPHLGPPAIHQIIPLHSSHGSSIEVQFQGTKYKWIYHHTYTMCIYPYIYIILWSPIYNYIYICIVVSQVVGVYIPWDYYVAMAWFFSSPSPLSGPWCSHWVIRVIRTQAFSTKFHKNGFWKRRCGPTPEGLGIQEKMMKNAW